MSGAVDYWSDHLMFKTSQGRIRAKLLPNVTTRVLCLAVALSSLSCTSDKDNDWKLIEVPYGPVNTVAFGRDGMLVAAGCTTPGRLNSGAWGVWDVSSHKLVHVQRTKRPVQIVCFSECKEWMFAATGVRSRTDVPGQASVAIIDTRSWRMRESDVIPGVITKMTISPDSRFLAFSLVTSSHQDLGQLRAKSVVRVLKIPSLEVVSELDGYNSEVQSLAFTDDSRTLEVADGRRYRTGQEEIISTIRCYDTQDWRLNRSYSTPLRSIESLLLPSAVGTIASDSGPSQRIVVLRSGKHTETLVSKGVAVRDTNTIATLEVLRKSGEGECRVVVYRIRKTGDIAATHRLSHSIDGGTSVAISEAARMLAIGDARAFHSNRTVNGGVWINGALD